jgi:hypothetical protein
VSRGIMLRRRDGSETGKEACGANLKSTMRRGKADGASTYP